MSALRQKRSFAFTGRPHPSMRRGMACSVGGGIFGHPLLGLRRIEPDVLPAAYPLLRALAMMRLRLSSIRSDTSSAETEARRSATLAEWEALAVWGLTPCPLSVE